MVYRNPETGLFISKEEAEALGIAGEAAIMNALDFRKKRPRLSDRAVRYEKMKTEGRVI